MVGWHHQLKGQEFEQASQDGKGQGSLACCSPWGGTERDTAKGLTNRNSELGEGPERLGESDLMQ